MNFTISKNDTVTDIIRNRIAYFKEQHEKHVHSKARFICQLKITTLEMVLHDLQTLKSLKASGF